MAQKQDPFDEFLDEDDPFAEFEESLEEPIPEPRISKPVISQAPQPTADDILRDAAMSLEPRAVAERPLPPNQVAESEPGFLDSLFSPLTTVPSRVAGAAAEWIDRPEEDDNPLWATIKGGIAGGVQGFGDVLSGMTSPADLAASVATAGAGSAINRGLRSAGMLRRAAQGLSALPAVHGGQTILDPDSTLQERGMGALELAGGLAGMHGVPKPKVPQDLPLPVPQSIASTVPKPPKISLPKASTLDYSVKSENKARGFLAGNDVPPEALEGMSNKEIIDLAETFKPGHQETPKKVRLKSNPDGSWNMTDPETARVITAAKQNRPVPDAQRIKPSEEVEMPDPPEKTGDPVVDEETWRDYLSIPRAIQSAFDLSFPFRQGLGLIHTKGWWKAWPDMVKSAGDENAYKAVMNSIEERPNFTRPMKENGRLGKSFAEEAGLAVTDLSTLSRREEAMGSRIAETIPGLGRGIRGSNRAYTAFANKLRADTFDSLIESAEKAGLDPRANMPLAKEIAKYVNNASGRGSFNSQRLEASAETFNTLFFSPRLMASRLQILNPAQYLMTNKPMRLEYMKSAMALGGAWLTFAKLAEQMGSNVVPLNDATNSDFGRIKIGNTRIDPTGGMLPFITLASRLGKGGYDALMGNEDGRYSGKFGAPSAMSDTTNFLAGKAAPLFRPAVNMATATTYKPAMLGDDLLRMFTPIQLQEISEILQDDPSLARLLGVTLAGTVGIGSNTYKQGAPPERLTGGIPPALKPFGFNVKDPYPMSDDLVVPRKNRYQ
jgi:hypothetical protein